ncbi:histone acetyltransferase type B catalytic subunit isoform X2 [Prorops nasuta]|uniref:histone acetyltransferase type B catalytic subunit isoform X2 n=1 Tax=Prorops nasuta TaxID=863751 RepID=UPI0034CDC7DD
MEDSVTARLKSLVVNSNDALEFKMIRKVQDLEDDGTTFKPEMSHQVFGDSETIFGYRDLKIKLYYSAGSLETYVGVSYSEKICKDSYEGIEADEILPKLVDKLAPKFHESIDSFTESLKKDENFRPHGELLHAFTLDDNGSARHFEVYKADMSYKGFKEYHQRLRTFVLWYIDAANFVDVDDDLWHYFTMFEKYDGKVGSPHYATIGFATVYQYYAYPRNTRPRIAQVLILPPFQGMGLGADLLRAIYREYVGRNEVKDITVEDPSVNFQRIRDFVDALNCSTLSSFSKENLLQPFNKSMAEEAREKLKINKKQARRVYEILRFRITDLSNEKEYPALKNLDKRQTNIALPPKEQRYEALEKEYRILEEAYKKVVERLQDEIQL